MNQIEVFDIDAEKLKRMLALHVRFILLDMRSKSRFDEAHIPNAFHIEIENFKDNILKLVPHKDIPIVIYDETGSEVLPYIQIAEEIGFLNIVYLQGGFNMFGKD